MAKIKEFDGGDDAEFRENMKQQEIIIRTARSTIVRF